MHSTIEINAENLIRSHLELLQQKGFLVSQPHKGNYHFEADIQKGSEKNKLLVYFGKKGTKVVLQGKRDSGTYQEINALIFEPELFLPAAAASLPEPEAYIGTDESGKGDFFGPLVIAGVFADEQIKTELLKIGVKDSKLLTDDRINSMASEIKRLVGDRFSVIRITPKTYNKLYLDFGNLNKLLGWGHAKVLENILEKQPAAEAISDKFGNESYLISHLQQKGKTLSLRQETKAEKYSAVAAASILARASLNSWFKKTSAELKIKIPKGASAEVEKTAGIIAEKFGREKLDELVKLHFKTTKKLNYNGNK